MKVCHHLLTLKLLQTCIFFFFLLLNTNIYFDERLEQNSCGAPLTFFFLLKTMVSNNCLVQIVLQNMLICVQQKKKLIQVFSHTGLQQHDCVSKL